MNLQARNQIQTVCALPRVVADFIFAGIPLDQQDRLAKLDVDNAQHQREIKKAVAAVLRTRANSLDPE